jgi:predicted DNA-binding transcriptional regulator YafY
MDNKSIGFASFMKQNSQSFTADELRAIYQLAKAHRERVTDLDDEDDYFDDEMEPISKRLIVSLLKKTSQYLPKEKSIVIDKSFLRRKYHTFNNVISPKVYATLKRGLNRLKTLEIKYFGMEKAEFTKRKLDVYYTTSRYTIGYCHIRKEIRTFRTSRIASAKLTTLSYAIPIGFDKNDY